MIYKGPKKGKEQRPGAKEKFFVQRKKRNGTTVFFQAKLKIGSSNDSYEKEADQVADNVIRSSDADSINIKESVSTVPIQRMCDACEEEQGLQRKEKSDDGSGKEVPDVVGDTLATTGKPLDEPTRSLMEEKIGFDFGQVKIHTDSLAAKSADAVNAQAYTSDNNIVFNTGKYSPKTSEGQKLLAHELTHVVQQRKGSARGTIKRSTGPDPSKLFPAELKYVQDIQSGDKILGTLAARKTAVKVVEYWKKGYPHFMLSTSLKILIVQELLQANTTLPKSYQEAIVSIVESMGKEELELLLNAVTLKTLEGHLTSDNTKKVKDHQTAAAKLKSSSSVFAPDRIMALRDTFLNNAQLSSDKKKVCIVILEDQLAKTYKGDKAEKTVKDAVAASGKDTTVNKVTLHAHSIDNLIHQLKGSAVEEGTFVTDYDRVKDSSGSKPKVPASSMKSSAWAWIEKSVGSQVGWHMFIMSVKHGYHSVTLFVEKRASGEMYLYWADQNWTGSESYLRADGGSMAGFKSYDKTNFDNYIDFATRTFWDDAYDDAEKRVKSKNPKATKEEIYRSADTKTTLTIMKLKRESTNNPYK